MIFDIAQPVHLQHITDEGTALVQQAEDAAISKVWHFSWSLFESLLLMNDFKPQNQYK